MAAISRLGGFVCLCLASACGDSGSDLWSTGSGGSASGGASSGAAADSGASSPSEGQGEQQSSEGGAAAQEDPTGSVGPGAGNASAGGAGSDDAGGADSGGTDAGGASAGGSEQAAGSGGTGEDPPGPELPPDDPGEDLTECNGTGMLGHPLPDFDYPEYTGFTLCLVEEFEEPIAIYGDDAIWTYSDGSLFEGDVRHTADALSFADGKLVITVREETAPVSWSWAAHSYIPEKPLKSGELRTKFNNFRYGRYEVRMKAPDVVGNFIATMFTFRTPGFQDWREIDVELLGSTSTTFLSNLIYTDDQELWSPDIEEPAYSYPFGNAPSGLPAGYDNRKAFHTYSFEWTPNQIRWFVDDALVRVKQSGVGEDQLPVPELPSKIFMNTWVFPNADFGGDPQLNEYPFSTEYEWFRFYKWDGEVTYPCSGAPSCLDESDLDYSKNNPDDGITPNP
jgi:beta-glucanase (GH16 family)